MLLSDERLARRMSSSSIIPISVFLVPLLLFLGFLVLLTARFLLPFLTFFFFPSGKLSRELMRKRTLDANCLHAFATSSSSLQDSF